MLINAIYFNAAIVALLLLAGWIELGGKWKVPLVYYFIVLMFAWSGNRFNGADWINYSKYYEILGGVGNLFDALQQSPFEWLISAWMWALSHTGLPYEGMVFSVALVNTTCILWFVKQIRVRSIGVALAILYLSEGWFLYHEQLREALAVSVCFVAYVRFLDRKYFSALFIVFLAFGLHNSAFFALLIFYVLWSVKRRDDAPLPVTRLFVLSILFAGFIAVFVVFGEFSIFSAVGLGRLQEKYVYYAGNNYGQSLFTGGLLAYPLCFAVLMLFRKQVINKRNRWASISWSLAVLWCLIGPWLRTIAILTRFEHYLLIFIPFACAYYPGDIKPKRDLVYGMRQLPMLVFSATFFVRIVISPEYSTWVNDYQNVYLSEGFPGLIRELEPQQKRYDFICNNLSLYNNFCE